MINHEHSEIKTIVIIRQSPVYGMPKNKVCAKIVFLPRKTVMEIWYKWKWE
jgi:hypothetical protein